MTESGTNAAGTNLAALKIPELRQIAAQQGLKGLSGLRKGELIEAINTGVVPRRAAAAAERAEAPAETTAAEGNESRDQDRSGDAPRRRATRRSSRPAADTAQESTSADNTEASMKSEKHTDEAAASHDERGDRGDRDDSNGDEQRYESRSAARRARRNRARQNQDQDREQDSRQDSHQDSRQDNNGNDEQTNRDRDRDNRDRDNREDSERGGRGNRNGRNNRDHNRDDADGNSRRGRRNRRNRNRGRGGDGNQGDNHNNNNDQNQNFDPADLQEVAGIVDVVDNNTAFIRTTGYRANQADVFVNNKLVRQNGLRSGDAVIGQVRANGQSHAHGNGRNRQRYNQLVRVDSVNGMSPEQAQQRKEFHKLTPLYPNKRLRLETEPNILTTRVIDLVMPIGKGQRALIVSPPKAGKTTIMQNIANAIATNNPECYLMVVLVDERPEEVTDMQRSVKGEVIASTFDRPPSEHTAVAELAIERAKRLVEMGQDVVVLLDSITRLGRAYNNSSPASGRILSGGVDSSALYPPKRFLGAARNIEEGGSLTIIATAMVETGSAGDTVIFEEFKG
ncbi:transcription termination factor Rho, partial [Corynebacterium sp.]|uniref:transcription termination factor Rho n=1 Tax=Corynebacterium sp. TaxID=1720 RepID=UPI002A91BA10